MPASSSGVAGRSVVYIVASTLQKLSALFLLPVYTRILTPEDYGYFNLLVTFTLFGAGLALMGMDFAVMRYCRAPRSSSPDGLPQYSGASYYSAAVSVVLVASMALTMTLLLLGPVTSPWIFPGLEFLPAVAVATTAVAFQPLVTLFLAALQGLSRAREFGTLSVSYFLVNAALTVGLVAGIDLGVLGTAIALSASNGIFAIIALIRSAQLGLLPARFRWSQVATLTSYGLPMMPHTLSLQGTSLAVRVIVSNTISVAAAGLFNIAMYAVSFIDAVQTALHRAYLPWFFAQMDKKPDGWRDEVRNTTVALISVNVVVAAVVGTLGYELLLVLAPGDYLAAATIIPILAVSMMVKSIYYPSLSVLLYERRGTRAAFAISGSSSILSLVLGFVGAITMGLYGVALSQVAQRLLMSALAVHFARRAGGVSVPWARVLRLQTAGIALLALVSVGDACDWWSVAPLWIVIVKIALLALLVIYTLLMEPILLKTVRKGIRRGN